MQYPNLGYIFRAHKNPRAPPRSTLIKVTLKIVQQFVHTRSEFWLGSNASKAKWQLSERWTLRLAEIVQYPDLGIILRAHKNPRAPPRSKHLTVLLSSKLLLTTNKVTGILTWSEHFEGEVATRWKLRPTEIVQYPDLDNILRAHKNLATVPYCKYLIISVRTNRCNLSS